jgi:RNA polymerase nonessential primary-like sigma factor
VCATPTSFNRELIRKLQLNDTQVTDFTIDKAPFMTVNAAHYASSHAGVATLQATTMAVAQRFLAFSICFDYLSKGSGHRQSRQVVAQRLVHQLGEQALPVAAAQRLSAPLSARGLYKQLDSEQRYLSDVAARPRLTSREEYGLAIRMKAGDTVAHDALIEANLGLVVMFARRYRSPKVPMLDLVAEGNFGLFTAAERFDPEMGCRFATYAKWWVIRAIQTAIPKLVGVVRLPAASHHAKSERQVALSLLDRQAVLSLASIAEVGSASDAEDQHTYEALADVNAVLSAEDVAAADDAWSSYCTETSDQEVLDTLTIPVQEQPPQAVMAAQRAMALQRALDGLPDRDRIVISRRFALNDDQEQPSTLDELACELGVSKERIRQIESAALTKLQRVLSQAGAHGFE